MPGSILSILHGVSYLFSHNTNFNSSIPLFPSCYEGGKFSLKSILEFLKIEKQILKEKRFIIGIGLYSHRS